MSNKEQRQEQPQVSPEKLKPKFYDKIADSFGFGKRWEKEAAYLEALEAQEETPETVEAAEQTVETIEKQAESTIDAEGVALQADVANTAKRVESLGVQDPQISSELSSVQQQAANMNRPGIWKRLWNWLNTSTWDRLANNTDKLNKKDAAAKKAESHQLQKDLATDVTEKPGRAKKLMYAGAEGLRTIYDKSTDAAINIASSLPGSSKNRMNKELRRQQQEEASAQAFEDSFDVPEVGTVIHDTESEDMIEVQEATYDTPEPAEILETEASPSVEEETAFTPYTPYAAAQELFTAKTAEFLTENPHGRTEEEQTKFAGFAAYEASTDSGLQAEVNALRKEWAAGDGIEGDYDADSEQYKLQTGEALRQVMERSEQTRSAESFEDITAAIDNIEGTLIATNGETVEIAQLKADINDLKLLAMNPDFSAVAIPFVTNSITRKYGLRESVQRLMNDLHTDIQKSDVAGLEGMADLPEVAGLGIELEAGAGMEEEEEPAAVGLEGMVPGGMVGGFGVEMDDGRYDALADNTESELPTEDEVVTAIDNVVELEQPDTAETKVVDVVSEDDIETRAVNTVDEAGSTQRSETARLRKARLDANAELLQWENDANELAKEARALRKQIESATDEARTKLEKDLETVQTKKRNAEGYARDMEASIERLDSKLDATDEPEEKKLAA